MDLNLEQMKDLIEMFEESDLTEINVSRDDYEVTLKKESGSVETVGERKPVQRLVESGDGKPDVQEEEKEDRTREGEEEAAAEEEDGAYVTSPIVGTFYRSPSPEDPSYVEVGDTVEEGETVCIVEAMKVMNEVNADEAGRVVEIHPEDGDPVEYGEKLMTLAPPEEGQ